MENHSTGAFSVRSCHTKERGKSIGGRSKSPRDLLKRLCWKCGKPSRFKKNCTSKSVERGKGSEDTLSKENKSCTEEGGDVYLASRGTQSEHDFWLIDLGASFHITPHREWFYEYEKHNGNVFLGDNSLKKNIVRSRVKLLLNNGRIKILLVVLHIPGLAINLISVGKMADAGVKTVFEKERCKMVQGAMVLMRGVQYGTLYKLLGRFVIDGCTNTIVPESKNEESKVPGISGGDTMLWHQGLGHIGEKGLQSLQGKGMVEGMSMVTWLIVHNHFAPKTIS